MWFSLKFLSTVTGTQDVDKPFFNPKAAERDYLAFRYAAFPVIHTGTHIDM
jgi:hypothetical protein